MSDGQPPTDELDFWLALNRLPGLTPRRAKALIEHFAGPRGLFEASRSALDGLELSTRTREALECPPWSGVAQDRLWLGDASHHALTLTDPRYPQQLLEIADPPPVLFVAGRVGVLAQPQLAMVGSRNPTATGRDTAAAFSSAFARVGLTVTSGLASGIDGEVHRGALGAGGETIAVTGSGPDLVYPREHVGLADEVAAHGAVVTEFSVGTPPRGQNFPRRNRIISGLSLGVLVVEAARRSGALSTARSAMEQGREVFAVPGSIHNPLAKGCHALLRAGAKLVETVEDVLEEIAGQCEPRGDAPCDPVAEASWAPGLDADYTALLDSMAYERVAVDTLVSRTGLTAEVVSSMLLLLELKGFVTSEPGGFYSRTTGARQR